MPIRAHSFSFPLYFAAQVGRLVNPEDREMTFRLGGKTGKVPALGAVLIPLDGKNTAIKKDDSKERYQQIQKLNAILETSNPASVYQLSAFSLPVQSPRRTSFFADRRIYTYQGGGQTTGLHYGIDFGVPEGTIVSACAAGKVVMAEMRNSTGYSVVIEHLPGLYSLYYHLSSMNVKAGQMVKQHDKIGLSGQTGLATGPHLHWEIRLNTAAVSPDFFTGNFAYEPVK